MCQTAIINQSLVGLSKRTFARRISAVNSPVEKERTALARLNRSLDGLYDLLYDNFPTATEDDYNSFGPYLQILIETLSDLKASYERFPQAELMTAGIESLSRNISTLTEIDSDNRNFRININHNERFRSLMDQLKAV